MIRALVFLCLALAVVMAAEPAKRQILAYSAGAYTGYPYAYSGYNTLGSHYMPTAYTGYSHYSAYPAAHYAYSHW